jgi:ribose transport system ATP-binding protein
MTSLAEQEFAHRNVSEPALAMVGVVKSFPGVRVLKNVSFECKRGEVHALLGENGAGKSTLVNIASGNISAEAGATQVGGTDLSAANPSAARRAGLAITYQDDSLIPDLSVAENLLLATPSSRRPPWRERESWARRELHRFHTDIDPGTPVRELPIASRQIVEIVKALMADAVVLVLDEPTAALTTEESLVLHRVLREAAGLGLGIVYITHRLKEVMAIGDRVSVLRDGVMVASGEPVSEVDEDRLVELMVGRSLDTTFPDRSSGVSLGDPVVRLENATSEAFSAIDLNVRAGEIVGLAGVEGSGQRELIRALAGLGEMSGTLMISGQPVKVNSVRAVRRAGVTFVSGDRRGEAVFNDLSVRDNMTIGSLARLGSLGLISRSRERSSIASYIRTLALKTPSVEYPVSSLSGGNQQKVAMGRALMEAPTVLLVEEPTQGVDAGTRIQIYSLLREQADAGAAVVVLSSDAIELSGLCDRVLVLSRGHVVATLAGTDLSETSIVGASARSEKTRQEARQSPDLLSRRNGLLRWAQRSDFAPVSLLLVALAVLMLVIGRFSSNFLSIDNMTNLMFLAVPLGFAALAQGSVMLTGGIDLSVGPVISLTTVVMATVMVEGGSFPNIFLAILVALAAGVAVGTINGLLVRALHLPPLVATLATYVAVQGVALLIRPVPGGYVNPEFATAARALVGFVPVGFLSLVAAAIGLEFVYRRKVAGLSYRAVGSRPSAARRLGVPVQIVYYASYILGGLLAAGAGIFFTATIQVGDPSLGLSFTLASVTAVVLGGMSTWGGRGSFLGAVAGAMLLATIANGVQFLALPSALQYYLLGGLLIGSIALYSRVRATGAAKDETTGER